MVQANVSLKMWDVKKKNYIVLLILGVGLKRQAKFLNGGQDNWTAIC